MTELSLSEQVHTEVAHDYILPELRSTGKGQDWQ